MRLLEKVAVVTGAGSGNGRAIALGFGREGARVVVCDIDRRGGEATVEGINAIGKEAIFVPVDVGDSADVSRAVETVLNRFGAIDVLVNNAGVLSRTHFLELTDDEWDRTLRVNLRGTFLCSRAAARVMKGQTRGGVVINISSISGEVARPNTAAYVASKGAVKMLTKAMALDLAQYRIRVNAIAPGYVRTAMTEGLFRDAAYLSRLRERIPLGDIAAPEDLVGPAVFLASEESRYVTGATLLVDGGWTAS